MENEEDPEECFHRDFDFFDLTSFHESTSLGLPELLELVALVLAAFLDSTAFNEGLFGGFSVVGLRLGDSCCCCDVFDFPSGDDLRGEALRVLC